MKYLLLNFPVSSGNPWKWSRHPPPGSPAYSGHPKRSRSALHQQQNLGVCSTWLEGWAGGAFLCFKHFICDSFKKNLFFFCLDHRDNLLSCSDYSKTAELHICYLSINMAPGIQSLLSLCVLCAHIPVCLLFLPRQFFGLDLSIFTAPWLILFWNIPLL